MAAPGGASRFVRGAPVWIVGLLGLTVAASSAQAATVVVTVNGLASDTGAVCLSLHDSEKDYRGAGAYRWSIVRPSGRAAVVAIDGVPAGRYAVKSFHDRNGNGKLDMGLLGMPAEPYGFSGRAEGRFGPPPFEKAAFAVDRDTVRVTVTVR